MRPPPPARDSSEEGSTRQNDSERIRECLAQVRVSRKNFKTKGCRARELDQEVKMPIASFWNSQLALGKKKVGTIVGR